MIQSPKPHQQNHSSKFKMLTKASEAGCCQFNYFYSTARSLGHGLVMLGWGGGYANYSTSYLCWLAVSNQLLFPVVIPALTGRVRVRLGLLGRVLNPLTWPPAGPLTPTLMIHQRATAKTSFGPTLWLCVCVHFFECVCVWGVGGWL